MQTGKKGSVTKRAGGRAIARPRVGKRVGRRRIAKTPRRAKRVYFFGEGKAEGHRGMRDLLGGKGAGLAEMTNAGLPVPPGFTISTDACGLYYAGDGALPASIEHETLRHLKQLERVVGAELGSTENPLLVSVRSGSKFSMPGMMDTILNLGLNDGAVEGLKRKTRNGRFAADSYRRFIQMFASVVLEVPKEALDGVLDRVKREQRVRQDSSLSEKALRTVIERYKRLVKRKTGKSFPQDPHEQLRMARDAVFRSWHNPRAVEYRRIYNIPDDIGTAVNVQLMVFGNTGKRSATGVGFTRNPATGQKQFYGEFLVNAQGEDVVAGIRTPQQIAELERLKSVATENGVPDLEWRTPAEVAELEPNVFCVGALTASFDKSRPGLSGTTATSRILSSRFRTKSFTCCRRGAASGPATQRSSLRPTWLKRSGYRQRRRFRWSIPSR